MMLSYDNATISCCALNNTRCKLFTFFFATYFCCKKVKCCVHTKREANFVLARFIRTNNSGHTCLKSLNQSMDFHQYVLGVICPQRLSMLIGYCVVIW